MSELVNATMTAPCRVEDLPQDGAGISQDPSRPALFGAQVSFGREQLGFNNGSAGAHPVSSFTGDRSAYDESKLWRINTPSMDYQERIWFR